MYKLIAVEGVSYVGKTSLSLKLAKSLKAAYGIRVAQGYESREKKIHKNPDAEARFRFFYEELVERSKQLQETSKHTDVISDRYLISVFAYHNVILKKRLEEKCDIDKIYPADFTIFLVADKENLKLRMHERPPRHAYEGSIKFLIQVQEEFLRFVRNVRPTAIIDTSRKPKRQVLKEVLSLLNEYNK